MIYNDIDNVNNTNFYIPAINKNYKRRFEPGLESCKIVT